MRPEPSAPGANNRWTERLMQVVWPAFMAACLLELIVFAMVDPSEIHWMGRSPGWSRQAIYAGAFFVFWAVCALASTLTVVLGRQGSGRAG